MSVLLMWRVWEMVPPANSSRIATVESSSAVIAPSSDVPSLSLMVSARAQSPASSHAASIKRRQVRMDSSLDAMNSDRDVLAERDAELFYLDGHPMGHLSGEDHLSDFMGARLDQLARSFRDQLADHVRDDIVAGGGGFGIPASRFRQVALHLYRDEQPLGLRALGFRNADLRIHFKVLDDDLIHAPPPARRETVAVRRDPGKSGRVPWRAVFRGDCSPSTPRRCGSRRPGRPRYHVPCRRQTSSPRGRGGSRPGCGGSLTSCRQCRCTAW